MTVIKRFLQMGFVGLILFFATACSGPNAGVQSGTNAGVQGGKHLVWVPSDTGSHIGGRWVAVDETGRAANAGASNVQTTTGAQLRAQVPSSGAPPSGATGTGR
jgi:hypothetical protein